MSPLRVPPCSSSVLSWRSSAQRCLLVVLTLLLAACASAPDQRVSRRMRRAPCSMGPCSFAIQVHDSVRVRRPARTPKIQPRGEVGPIEAQHLDVDYFFGLLVRAGVPTSALPKDQRRLKPEQALELLNHALAAQVALKDFGPWRMAMHLLLEVAQADKAVSRQALHARLTDFNELLVLRPDGYLVRATTGRAVQHMGQVRLEHGALRAEGFEVGPFYKARGGELYPVDATLDIHLDARVAGVYLRDEGTLGPMVEGVGRATVDAVSGIIELVLHPGQSLEALAHLPSTVRTLVENSPEYYEHFQSVSHGERVRLVSRLMTNVALVFVTAGAGSARVASAGRTLGSLRVPVLRLSAQGTLALERVVVPAGRAVTAVSGAPGALYILHMAGSGAGGGGSGKGGWKPPVGGPGRWVQKNEAMLEPARKYQRQVTQAPDGWTYRVEHAGERADLDDFATGKLIEAKGPGYSKFLDEDLKPLHFFEGFRKMLETARRQHRIAQGVPIQWIVAEKRLFDYLRAVFKRAELDIEVVHIPAQH